MRGKWLLISGIAALAAVAAGSFMIYRRSRAPVPPTAPVRAAFAGDEVSVTGKIRAQSVVEVPAPVDGTVESVLVEPGQPVYEGQLLGRIRNSSLQVAEQEASADAARVLEKLSALETELIGARTEASRTRADAVRAQNESDRAERVYLRQQMLHREGATPRLVFEKSASEFQAAKKERDTRAEVAKAAEDRMSALVKSVDAARQSMAEKNEALDDAREQSAAAEMHSPADGMLVACTKDVGAEVTTAVRDLFQIAVNLTALEAVVEPEPAALARIRAGQDALLQFAEVPEGIPGKVKAVEGAQAIVEFTSPSPALKPGSDAQVLIKLR